MAGKTQKKIKYLNPKMKFNYGTMKYEPEINLKTNKDNKPKISWLWIILLLIFALILIILAIR